MADKADFETVTWQGTAGIEQAHELRDELLAAFEKSSDVRLDISKVEDIDITGIQIIIAAQKEAEKQRQHGQGADQPQFQCCLKDRCH